MFAAVITGGVGGLLAAGAAQLLTVFADRTGGSENWLKGPHGPPFFNVCLFMGIMYGGIAWALSRRRNETLIGSLGPLLGIALPLIALERWRELPWEYVVITVFILAVWGTIVALGWRLGHGWRGAIGAVLGSFTGYLILQLIQYLSPAIAGWRLYGYLPPPIVLIDGLLTGAGIAVGIHLLGRNHGKIAGA